MRYYKRKNEDSWHWCPNCENFPVDSDEIIIESEQCEGEKCKICQKLEDNSGCFPFEPLLQILFLFCVKQYFKKTGDDFARDQECVIKIRRDLQLILERETARLHDEESERRKKYDEWLAKREKIICFIKKRLLLEEKIEIKQCNQGEVTL